MNISLEEAVVIHARVLFSRRGKKAKAVAMNRANAYCLAGDLEGFEIWQSVAKQIEMFAAETGHALTRQNAN